MNNSDTVSKRKVTFIYPNRSFDAMISMMNLYGLGLENLLERDDENPDYVIAANECFMSSKFYSLLKKYMHGSRDRIFILLSRECVEPDLNVFDYATTWNRKHIYPGRIIHNVPSIYGIPPNDFTREGAAKILREAKGFCNFIYSHPSPARDNFFHMLSGYKRVDSYGKCFNNTGTESTRGSQNWYDLSIDIKKGYKFSIAMENASFSGYTSEKIITSLRAHTIPIYWGDPDITDFINPEAFINCNDYSSFNEVIEKVKEIDNNDDLWLDMVTKPLQTEEQRQKTIDSVKDYRKFFADLFSRDINTAKRRPEGTVPDVYFENFGCIELPFHAKIMRELKRIKRQIMPEK